MVRDDFSDNVKQKLAQRVGNRCSNPGCKQLTSGPTQDPSKSINIGVAAHITAASSGGPRYDASLTVNQRVSIDNGIWLCQNCAKLVDNDPVAFPASILRNWKKRAEKSASAELSDRNCLQETSTNDVKILKFFASSFDRPAFRVPFEIEGSMEAFDKAMEDTITAINTGALRARDGVVLNREKGKAFLENPAWRKNLDEIVERIEEMRNLFRQYLDENMIHLGNEHNGRQFYIIRDDTIITRFDNMRAAIGKIFGQICIEAGLNPPRFVQSRPARIEKSSPQDLYVKDRACAIEFGRRLRKTFEERERSHDENAWYEMDASGFIQKLRIHGKGLDSLPSNIGDLHALHELDFGANPDLTELPISFCKLVNLKRLEIALCNIAYLPAALGDLRALIYLDLYHNGLVELPPSICQLSDLEVLKIQENNLQILPEKFGELANLKILHVDYKTLQERPGVLTNLSCLEELDIYDSPRQSSYAIQKVINELEARGVRISGA